MTQTQSSAAAAKPSKTARLPTQPKAAAHPGRLQRGARTNPILYGREAIAAYLGLTLQRTAYLITAGHLPVARAGRRIYIARAKLDAWIDRETPPLPAADAGPPPAIDAFLAARVALDAGVQVKATELYRAYLAFAAQHGGAACTQTRFGREMGKRLGASVPAWINGRNCRAYNGARLS